MSQKIVKNVLVHSLLYMRKNVGKDMLSLYDMI